MTPYDFSLLTPRPKDGAGIPQNTQEWLDARRGRITASDRAFKLITGRDSTISTMMESMAAELLVPAADGPSFAAGAHGHAFEDQAIGEFDMMRLSDGAIVRTPGMFIHPEFDIASATPDFFEGDDGTGQIKCPLKLKNHLELLHFGVAPRPVSPGHPKYYCQCQFESFITRRPRIIFVSYHPEAPPTNQVYIEYIKVDEDMHAKFAEKLEWVNHMLVNNERPAVEKNFPGIDGIPDLF